ncbi:MAG TPA: hypothetical protein VJH37_01430 [Candidatus Nanoarchaeia archaeon]|nr:hypothetical protein [Candidatus Nanoarchaeia archaeon]
MTKEKPIFLDYVGDTPRMRILQYFIEGREFDYMLTDLINARVSWGTLNSLVPTLAKKEVIIKTRKIGRATLYKINQESFVAQQLMKLYDHLILEQLLSREKSTKKVIKQVA